MQIAPWLLVTTTFTAPAPPPQDISPTPVVAIAAMDASQRTPQRPVPLATGQNQEPEHRFGIGANITMSNYGGAVSARYFFGDHLGVSLQAGYYRRPVRISSTTSDVEYATAIRALPSIMYMFGQTDDKKPVTLRPYAGAGAHFIDARGIQRLPGALGQRVRGVGMEVYGGAELSFLEYPDLTISNELTYLELPSSFGNSFNRWNYAVAVHFYLK